MSTEALPIPKFEAQASSRRVVLRARQRRARQIRRVVVAVGVATFLACWIAIYAQLASGHDPALTANARSVTLAASGSSTGTAATPTTTSASRPTATSTTTTTTVTSAAASTAPAAATTTSSSSSPTPVTTKQS